MSTLEQLNMNINFNSTSSVAKSLTKVTKVTDISNCHCPYSPDFYYKAMGIIMFHN